jgi:subtilase family serine protease
MTVVGGRMNIRRQLLALGTAGVLGIGGAIASVAPSVAAPNTAPVRIAGEGPPKVPHGAVRLGAVAPKTRIHVDVTLKLRDPAALHAFLAAISDRHSPLFHHFLRPGQFGPMFGPALSSVNAVQAALRQAGLSPGRVTSNRLIIPVSATAAAVERAFGTALVRYRLPGGRIAYANTTAPKIAANVAPYVSGVIGLDNLVRQQRMLARPSPRAAAGHHALATRAFRAADASGPQPCSAAKTEAADTGSYTANELASYYLMSPFYGQGDLGSGVRVGLFELEPNSTSDISAYKSCYGISTSVSYVKVDGGAGSGTGGGEAALDIEDVIGLAPDAAVDVYQAPNSSTGSLDNYSAMITADKDAVISTSWGQCELYESATVVGDEQTLFEQANSQGQTVFAAAGDTGSTGCLRSGGPDAGSLSAGDPSSQPYVIGVGGTTATASAETVWNESALEEGAGGGGNSADWCMPSYQYQTEVPGLINSDSVKNSGCPTAEGTYVREDPDVTADADPQTGYVIYFSGSWTAIGGTSAAAPLWAAIAALIDASPFCADYGSGDVGVLPQGLWETAEVDHSYIYSGGATEPEIVFDITSGNNDYTPSGYTGGLYPATTGYDQASGLGSPIVAGVGSGGSVSMFYPGLAAAMCRAYATKLTTDKITSISPTSGPTKGGTKVTVKGAGFMPISGADMAEIGTKLIKASCTSTTKCTFKTPKHASGTVDIRMIAEDYAVTPVTTKDRFKYKA